MHNSATRWHFAPLGAAVRTATGLDAEFVEIGGVLIALRVDRAELLARDGTTVIQSNDYYPLPAELLSPTATRPVGARLELREVFATSWNRHPGRLQPGAFLLGNANLPVVEMHGPQ